MFFIENETKEDIKKFVISSFPKHNVEYSDKVNKTQEEWQSLYKRIDDELVWVCSKYNHCFVDSDIKHLNDVIQFRHSGGTDKLASICLSNWLESLKKCVIIDHGIWDGEKHPAPTQAWIAIDECDSFQIATKALYHSWFFDQDFEKIKATNLEELNRKIDFIRPWKIQVPSKEILRNTDTPEHEFNFSDSSRLPEERRRNLEAYYFSKISPNEQCLANPNFDAGIYNRILRHYKLN
jgi:hypothetical protein